MKLPPGARFSTICIHAGQTPDPGTGAIITPIFQTSTYVQEELGRHKGYEYARTQNPTRAALEANIAAIEGGKAAFAFASGMAAIDAITTLLEGRRSRGRDRQHLRRHVPAVRQGADALPARVQLRRHVAAGSRRARRCGPNTKMLFVETPTNPVLRLTDIAQAAEIAQRARARGWSSTTRSRARACSSRSSSAPTWSSHSTTKYLNGHSDSIGGVVIATRDEDVEWLQVHPERRRRDPQPVRFLAGAARHEDAGAPHGAAQRERPGARRVPRRRTRRSRR